MLSQIFIEDDWTVFFLRYGCMKTQWPVKIVPKFARKCKCIENTHKLICWYTVYTYGNLLLDRFSFKDVFIGC